MPLPQFFGDGVTLEDVFWLLERCEKPTPAIWSGYIPAPDHYQAVYTTLASRNIYLPNTLEQHLRSQELDRGLERLGELTPRTCVVRNCDELDSVAEELGFPLFLKGAVQSVKAVGVKGCIVYDRLQLHELGKKLLGNTARSRGRIMVREFVELRHVNTLGNGLPIGREYRCFILCGKVIGLGYYWDGEDALSDLSNSEEIKVRALALEAASRMEVPFITIDIGQKTDGEWIVIETGDGQFSGVSEVPILEMWSRLIEGGNRWLPDR